jgi:hypothetical protein
MLTRDFCSLAGGITLTLVLSSVAATQQPPRSRLWGTLEPGRYGVGFRQLLLRDVSRPALAAGDGATVGNGRGRQMQIAVWYPAATRSQRRLRYGDYVDRLAQELDFRPITESARRHALETFFEMPTGFGGDTVALRRELARLLALSTEAALNAPPALGQFPLVLFPNYRAPASNSVIGEYLASHGFVVASPTLKGTYDSAPETSVRGLETYAADLRFVLSALDALAYVDGTRVAAMGVGVAASAALALEMRLPELRALVSLDGGITTALELGIISATPYFDAASVRAPMLAITAPHPSVDPARLDVYRYATRHLVHFPRMGEFWFLNYGTLEREVPKIIGQTPGDVALGFEWGARWVRLFLDGYLKSDSTALATLVAGRAPAGAPDSLFTVAVRRALPPPPTVAELKQRIVTAGVTSLSALVDQRRATDSQPIPSDYLAQLSSWLGNSGRDRSGNQRYELAVLRARLFPNSARARFSLGMSASARNDSALARTHLAEALRLLPGDSDPALDVATRERIERQARDALARLGTR